MFNLKLFLQVIVWGDYGRMDHKAFMGGFIVSLDDLGLSTEVDGWYKLFPASSLDDVSLLGTNRGGSMTSLEIESKLLNSPVL